MWLTRKSDEYFAQQWRRERVEVGDGVGGARDQDGDRSKSWRQALVVCGEGLRIARSARKSVNQPGEGSVEGCCGANLGTAPAWQV